MEESEKRKERLRAMRMEATHSEFVGAQNASTPPGQLVNPLMQPSLTSSSAESSTPFPRFDYYTDPMSAFSGNKRRGNSTYHNPADNLSSPIHSRSPIASSASPFPGPRRTHMSPIPTPSDQFQVNYPPYQGPYGIQLPFPQSTPWLSPSSSGSPYPAQLPTPQSAPWLSPASPGNPFSVLSPVNVPGVLNRGPSGHGFPHNASRGSFTNPGGRGSNRWTNPGGGSPRTDAGRGSRITYSGRGNNLCFGNSPSHPGYSSGGRQGLHGHVSASNQPHMFYTKQIFEDPWFGIKPVVGNILVPLSHSTMPDSLNSWLPKSVVVKKAKVDETGKGCQSQVSLAEYLAQSFREAANDVTESSEVDSNTHS